jgi:uncharacterized protein (TIGR02145 family)
VNFTNNFGCTAPTPTHLPVTVNPLPVTTISEGPEPTCTNAAHTYQTVFDPACTYNWSLIPAASGLITTGQGSNSITVNWLLSGLATVSVTGTNTATACFSGSSFPVTVFPSPEPLFTPCFDVKTTSQAKKFNLRGVSPYLSGQGVFSGNRVSLNASTGFYEFDPFGAGPGAYQVTYTYTNTHGCAVSAPAVTINVISNSFSCGGNLTDVRDGKTYKTSMIGGKCWMRENLAYGTIVDPPAQPQSDNCVAEKYCLPVDATCTAYGGLYQWDELMAYGSTSQNQGLCPPEWHIPTESEWQLMINSISTGITPPADGVAGSFIKDAFLNPGFYALTKGLYYLNNTWAYASGTLTGTMYWTSTPSGNQRAIARGASIINPSASKYPGSRGNAFSVRCVRD